MTIADADFAPDPTTASSLRRRITFTTTTTTNSNSNSNNNKDEDPHPMPPSSIDPNCNDHRHLANTFRPSLFPAHKHVRESPLSSDAIFKQSHAGLLNLCIIVLIAINSRLIIENLMKYGLLIRTGFWFSSKSLRDWPLLMCCLTLPVFPFAAFLVEKMALKKCISEHMVVWLHIIISTGAVVYPVSVILMCDSAVQSGVVLMLFTCIVWLKLVSYAHTSYDLRVFSKSGSKDGTEVDYKRSVTLKSLVYFMVAPTLCYQPSYPRTPSIRKRWVIRQVIKLVIFTGLMGFIVEQYINPIVQKSQHPLKGNLLYAIERILKLSVPTLYVWLCMFYCFFHLWLNILAELLCFGDREFYKDWWNAKTVEEYWRMWNMPVHKWMVRHLYFPCLRRGIPKGFTIMIVFFASAAFHELCIAVPCHIFKLWAFMGIMFQHTWTADVPPLVLPRCHEPKRKSNIIYVMFHINLSAFRPCHGRLQKGSCGLHPVCSVPCTK